MKGGDWCRDALEECGEEKRGRRGLMLKKEFFLVSIILLPSRGELKSRQKNEIFLESCGDAVGG